MVNVRFFAAARQAAGGRDEFEVGPGTLEEIKAACVSNFPELEGAFPRCSILIDGTISHSDLDQVFSGSTVDVLPPFAGG